MQFFDHPVIIDFLKDTWRGNSYEHVDISRREWVFLSVCCLFDVFIFPLIFLLTSVVGNIVYSIRFHKDSVWVRFPVKLKFLGSYIQPFWLFILPQKSCSLLYLCPQFKIFFFHIFQLSMNVKEESTVFTYTIFCLNQP